MQRDDSLRLRIAQHLKAFAVQTAAGDQHHAAAVAVAITDEGHGAELPGFPAHAGGSDQGALILTRGAAPLR